MVDHQVRSCRPTCWHQTNTSRTQAEHAPNTSRTSSKIRPGKWQSQDPALAHSKSHKHPNRPVPNWYWHSQSVAVVMEPVLSKHKCQSAGRSALTSHQVMCDTCRNSSAHAWNRICNNCCAGVQRIQDEQGSGVRVPCTAPTPRMCNYDFGEATAPRHGGALAGSGRGSWRRCRPCRPHLPGTPSALGLPPPRASPCLESEVSACGPRRSVPRRSHPPGWLGPTSQPARLSSRAHSCAAREDMWLHGSYRQELVRVLFNKKSQNFGIRLL